MRSAISPWAVRRCRVGLSTSAPSASP
jgi:hypothetical protein